MKIQGQLNGVNVNRKKKLIQGQHFNGWAIKWPTKELTDFQFNRPVAKPSEDLGFDSRCKWVKVKFMEVA